MKKRLKKELSSDYQKVELEIKKNKDNLDVYIDELKAVIIKYSNSLSPKKLGLQENEKDQEKIKKARQDFADDNTKTLCRHNIIPLAVWYVRNLDQVDTLEKQILFPSKCSDSFWRFQEREKPIQVGNY